MGETGGERERERESRPFVLIVKGQSHQRLTFVEKSGAGNEEKERERARENVRKKG